ncbi:UTRA domain-containing protein [Amycolatopsis stemonae]
MSPTKTTYVADRLRRNIHDGVWKPGDRLPTHAELGERFNTSPVTIGAAVKQLVAERLLMTSTSRGTIVRSQEVLDHVVTDFIRPDRPPSAISDVFVETVRLAGREPSKEFAMRMEPANAEVARWLGIEPESWVVVRTLRQLVDGEPWSWEESWYPKTLAEEAGLDSPHDIPEGTTRRLADRGLGEVAWRDSNHARPATPDEAMALAVPTGTWITDYIRIGANPHQITRVTRKRSVADRNRLIHELGDHQALGLICAALNRDNDRGEDE